MTKKLQITILGVGNILLKDEGVGVRVIEYLKETYTFPENVQIVDGGVLGMQLIGLIGNTDILIVVDAVKNHQSPGTLYRLADDEIPRRVLAKQSMHQLDLPEVLAICSAIDKNPQTMVIGIEPEDIYSLDIELTPTIAAKMNDLTDMVLAELDQLEIPYTLRKPEDSRPMPVTPKADCRGIAKD